MEQIPERKRFLSRKTTFPMFSNDVADGWLQLLNLVMRIGTDKTTGQGDRIAEALNAIVTIQLAAEEEELAPYLDLSGADVDEHYRRFTSTSPTGDSGPALGQRLHDWNGLSQFDAAIERLKQSHDTRSGTLVLIDPQEMGSPQNTPSILSATFNVIEGALFGSFVIRSMDVYAAWPLEALSLTRLQREAAARLGIDVGSATFVIHSAHLCDRDWASALRVLDESFKRPLPLQEDASGIFLFGNDGGKARAMLLNHDASAIQWEETFTNPEDLSWYIIDIMPWLLPQHIRYVGQECASLMRAMRECECYEQG